MIKEIIIDGVDVSGCEQLFKLAKRKCALLDQVYCEDNPDCYYKQLKRLQVENDKLKKEFKEEHAELLMSRAENERLKAELKSQQMVNLKQQDIAQDYWNALEESDAYFEVLENIMPTITLPDGNDSPRAIKEARELINEVLK